MRESNFAFPAQNRACVCITAQLYDRRALDTTSSLPLFNSLTHLTYLTSTSPRIREIMTMDGGLERLVRILHDFCLCPPPPENPAVLYGLSPPNARQPKLVPTLNPQSFDKHAAYRFSLAFQCVVNIGVRGSEDIRGRVVQAGTLDVVGCILEAWLANKGFAVGPSSSATGMPRETREQRLARRQAQAELRQREEAAELARALQRQIAVEHGIRMDRGSMMDEPSSNNDTDADTSTDTSTNATPVRSGTPTGTVLVPGRERSGTVVAQPIWDEPPPTTTATRHHHRTHRPFFASPDTSQPNTETEDDGDVDMDRDNDASPDRRALHSQQPRARRAVGIVSDAPAAAHAPLDVNADAHIIINAAQVVGGDGVGVEDGIVSLEPNDDFAMGAPPGAPGAIDDAGPIRRDATIRGRAAPDATPRAGTMDLPMAAAATPVGRPGRRDTAATLTPAAARGMHRTRTGDTTTPATAAAAAGGAGGGAAPRAPGHGHHHHHRDADAGPYRDEDVLLSLQLLAYLSKYPHVRQAFYKSRATFHPASANLPSTRPSAGAAGAGSASNSSSKAPTPTTTTPPVKEQHGFFRAFSTSRGKEKEKISPSAVSSMAAPPPPAALSIPSSAARQTNVFSLVERFTFRPSSTETDLPNPPPRLPPEIQYWAGVIMRNACRKDESRGGIRQCANMICGKWETYPREFAKCRRCRKAKYCGKECQSTAWSEGHRFWCSAKEGDDEETADPGDQQILGGVDAHVHVDIEVDGDGDGAGPMEGGNVGMTAGGTVTARAERRAERERERNARERAFAAAGGAGAGEAASPAPRATMHNLPASVQAHVMARAGGAANRPLLAPPTPHQPPPPWATRLVIPDGTGPSSAAGAAVNLDRDFDRQMSPARRRAETVAGVTTPSADGGEGSRRGTSRYFPGAGPGAGDVGAGAGPSRRRRGGDHDMPLD